MTFYFDTSALVKLFHEEEGSEPVTRIINSNDNEIWISELARIEFISPFCADIETTRLATKN